MSENKPKLSLIPMAALWAAGDAFTYGELKHGKYTWKNDSHTITEMLDKALRHITQFANGENIDKESSVLHLGSAMADIAIAIDLFYNFKHLDDRYKAEPNEEVKQVNSTVTHYTNDSGQTKMMLLEAGDKIINPDSDDVIIQTNGTFPVKHGSGVQYGD